MIRLRFEYSRWDVERERLDRLDRIRTLWLSLGWWERCLDDDEISWWRKVGVRELKFTETVYWFEMTGNRFRSNSLDTKTTKKRIWISRRRSIVLYITDEDWKAIGWWWWWGWSWWSWLSTDSSSPFTFTFIFYPLWFHFSLSSRFIIKTIEQQESIIPSKVNLLNFDSWAISLSDTHLHFSNHHQICFCCFIWIWFNFISKIFNLFISINLWIQTSTSNTIIIKPIHRIHNSFHQVSPRWLLSIFYKVKRI